MSNEIATVGQGSSIAVRGMDEALRLADAMASAKMVPTCLQKSPGDCLMVIEQAMRWSMSPFAVAQATSVVKGKLCFEGKLVSAAIQSSGVLAGRLNYEFTGEGEGRAVICSGTIKGEKKPRTVEVTLVSARTDNQWWRKTPDQMLTYHASRVWARRHTPEVMLGVYSPDEFDTQPRQQMEQAHDVIDVEEAPPQRPEKPKESPEQKVERLASEIEGRIQSVQTRDELDNLLNSPNYKGYMAQIKQVNPRRAETVEDNVAVAEGRISASESRDTDMQEMPA